MVLEKSFSKIGILLNWGSSKYQQNWNETNRNKISNVVILIEISNKIDEYREYSPSS